MEGKSTVLQFQGASPLPHFPRRQLVPSISSILYSEIHKYFLKRGSKIIHSVWRNNQPHHWQGKATYEIWFLLSGVG